MKTFYERLFELVQQQQTSFYKLSFKTEIPTSHFSQWKNGKRQPTEAEVQRIAERAELGVDL